MHGNSQVACTSGKLRVIRDYKDRLREIATERVVYGTPGFLYMDCKKTWTLAIAEGLA